MNSSLNTPLPLGTGESEPKSGTVKDSEYWMQGEFIVFQAGETLFRVPSYQFSNNSEFFAGMFNLPQTLDAEGRGSGEGRSAEWPLVLPAPVTAKDFRNFLKAIYPHAPNKHMGSGFSEAELISVLKLSTLWYFLDHRAAAIERLSKLLNPAQKIVIGREYNISHFLIDALELIIKRPDQMKDDEAVVIGALTAVALLRLREKWKKYKKREQTSGKLNDLIAGEACLSDELQAIKEQERGYNK